MRSTSTGVDFFDGKLENEFLFMNLLADQSAEANIRLRGRRPRGEHECRRIINYMINAILGTKLGQTQTFTPQGQRIPVTEVVAGPCWVARVSDHGTWKNVQLAFGNKKNITKAIAGHMKKAGLEKQKPRFLREIRDANVETLAVGTTVTASEVFAVGDKIRVTGVSKGKGFAGVVKRHGFHGGPRTHGQSDRERAPGSIGQTTTPGRVYRGKRMAGRMGGDNVTVGGLEVVAINAEKNTVMIKGVVPGAKQGLLLIQKE